MTRRNILSFLCPVAGTSMVQRKEEIKSVLEVPIPNKILRDILPKNLKFINILVKNEPTVEDPEGKGYYVTAKWFAMTRDSGKA